MSLTVTLSASDIINQVNALTSILTLISGGNQSLVTAGQLLAIQATLSLFNSLGGTGSYTFSATQVNNIVAVNNLIASLPGLGPVLTYTENIAAAGSITPISDPNFPNGCQTVTFNDSYFIVEQPGTANFFVSNSNDRHNLVCSGNIRC